MGVFSAAFRGHRRATDSDVPLSLASQEARQVLFCGTREQSRESPCCMYQKPQQSGRNSAPRNSRLARESDKTKLWRGGAGGSAPPCLLLVCLLPPAPTELPWVTALHPQLSPAARQGKWQSTLESEGTPSPLKCPVYLSQDKGSNTPAQPQGVALSGSKQQVGTLCFASAWDALPWLLGSGALPFTTAHTCPPQMAFIF